MAERPRKFWQLHLSTALASMLLASVLLGFNLAERDAKDQYQAWYAKDYIRLNTWGWPFEFGQSGELKKNPSVDNMIPGWRCSGPNVRGNVDFTYWFDEPVYTALENLIVCAGLTLAFAALCEFSIRLEMKRRARNLVMHSQSNKNRAGYLTE